LHYPLDASDQLGATVRRVADSLVHPGGKETKGLTSGMVAALFGLVEDVPVARAMVETAKLFDPRQRPKAAAALAKSLTVPIAASKVAEWTDPPRLPFSGTPTTKRKPQGIWENIETGVPGLRQRVKKAPYQH